MTVTILGAPTSPVNSGSQFTLTAKGSDAIPGIPAHTEMVRLEGTASIGGGTPSPWEREVVVNVPAGPDTPEEIVNISSVTWIGGGGAVGPIQNNGTNAPSVLVTVP